MTRIILVILAILFARNANVAAQPSSRPTTTTKPSIVRKPQWPLKDRRTLFTDDEIARARANVAKHESAKHVADGYVKLADEWLAWDDAKLAALIPSAAVPRDWGISADPKCPECGKAIGDPNNKPGWIVDPHVRFKVKCPLCNAVFPTNDYETYYDSDLKTKLGWDTKYVDDGWGWVSPKTGERYWFVAFANHWTLHGKLMNVVQALGRAYLLTGDKRYAHKALVLLHRYAEVYPEMDYGAQSRYGALMRAQGKDYPGKLVYNTWEADFVTVLVEAYDECWDAIDSDGDLQALARKDGKQIRAVIEANLLEDAIDAYFQGKILGNFGMHQSTLAHLGIVREYGEQQKWFDLLMNQSSPNYQWLGLNFALYNDVFRDGFSLETSSHYNSLWVRKISEYASILDKAGQKPFEIPKLHRLYDAVLAMIVTRAQNPAVGDGGSVFGGVFPHDPASFETAWRHYRDPRYLQYVFAMYGPPKDGGFKSFASLFDPPIEESADANSIPTTHPAQPSRLLDGYGMGILNNRADSVGASLYYGPIASHGHYDRLHFDLFANGQPMMPDLGYPDGANDFDPGIVTWSKNTVAHNTVVVDAHRQTGNVPGTVNFFVDGSFARAIDVSASGTYPQCEQYRRAIIMVDCGNEQSYFVDVFTVAGGKQHDYTLHGPPGTFEAIGGQWTEQPRGTLAGEDVQIGQFYDDAKLGAPNYHGGYGSYTGSGFQHFYNVRRLVGGSVVVGGGETVLQWSHEKDPTSKLRVRVLDQQGQQLILGNARVSPVKHPEVLTYLIARRQGEENLASRFFSVIEPFKNEPLVRQVRALKLIDGGGCAVEVVRNNGGRDVILYDLGNSTKTVENQAIATDAQVAVIRYDQAGDAAQLFSVGGGFLKVLGRDRVEQPALIGQVVAIDPTRSRMRVRPDLPGAKPDNFVGRVVHFTNELHRTAHPIISATREGDDIVVTTADDLLVGRARVETVSDDAVRTKTALPLAPIYRGTSLADASFQPLSRVVEVNKGSIRLATPIALEKLPKPGDDVWLINVAAGDRFELPALIDVAN